MAVQLLTIPITGIAPLSFRLIYEKSTQQVATSSHGGPAGMVRTRQRLPLTSGNNKNNYIIECSVMDTCFDLHE